MVFVIDVMFAVVEVFAARLTWNQWIVVRFVVTHLMVFPVLYMYD